MSDENRFPPDDSELPSLPDEPGSRDEDSEDIAPSTLFVEMMREAAARRAQLPSSDKSSKESEWPEWPEWMDSAIDRDALQTSPLANPEPPKQEEPAEHDRAWDEPQRDRYDDVPSGARGMEEPWHTNPTRTPQPAPEPPAAPADAAPIDAPAASAAPTGQPRHRERTEQRMETQRIQRIKRRKERRRQRRVGMIGGFLRTVLIVVLAAGLASTIFTWFTSPAFFAQDVVSGLQVAEATVASTAQPTTLPTPNWMKRIGVVSGHRGPEDDPGAVCPNDPEMLTEAEINFNVAQIVVRNLRQLGYSVDLLDEFDPRLDDYQAVALVSIHANSCTDYGERVSGYLVAKAAARPGGGPDEMLAECIARHYQRRTQLERHYGLTLDMTDYHTFREIHPLTPAAIIELGFMLADRDMLVNQPDLMARGITEGVLCFLNGEGEGEGRVPVVPTVPAQPPGQEST